MDEFRCHENVPEYMAISPIRVLNFKIRAPCVADEIPGLFSRETTTTPKGISTPRINKIPYQMPYVPLRYGIKAPTPIQADKKIESWIAFSIPAVIGKVLCPADLSPSISAISFTNSRTKVRPKARIMGIHIRDILLNAAPQKRKDKPKMKAIVIFPTSGMPFKNLV